MRRQGKMLWARFPDFSIKALPVRVNALSARGSHSLEHQTGSQTQAPRF